MGKITKIVVANRGEIALRVMRSAKESGIKTVAVTLNKNSKLAKVCQQIVPLKITKINTVNAGFSTFVGNIVTCLQIAGIDVPLKFDTWHEKGIELSLNLLNTVTLPQEKERLCLLGNNILYAIVLYISFQMAEFFGTTATPHKLEEFCHSPIFGLKKSDYVWILGQNEKRYSSRLERLNLRVSYMELYNSDVISQVFQSIFLIQNLMLLLAKRHGYTERKFLLKEDVLKASSNIIYNDLS